MFIQLIHNRKVKLIATGFKIFPWEWDAVEEKIIIYSKDSQRVYYLLALKEKIEMKINIFSALVASFENRGNYSLQQLLEAFENKGYGRGFFSFMEKEVSKLEAEGQLKTSLAYACALRCFRTFRGGQEVAVEQINGELMKNFEIFLKARGITSNTISFYMRVLRAAYNKAVNCGLGVQTYPFRFVYTGIDKTHKRAVDENIIGEIQSLNLSGNEKLGFARDLFLFSFYTRGMSFVDMAYLRKGNIRGGLLYYTRRKTGQQLTIRMEPCIWDIVRKYAHLCADNDFLLPILSDGRRSYELQRQSALRLYNKRLKVLSGLLGLSVPLASYVARHTWATIAKRQGIPVRIISEGMGHESETTTQIYLASLDQELIDEANRKIIYIAEGKKNSGTRMLNGK